jgi:hypothetical protein
MSVNPYESPQMASPLGAQPRPLELPLTIEYEPVLDDHVEFNICYQRQIYPLWIFRLLLPAILMLAVASILLFSVIHLFSNPQGPQDEEIRQVISSVAMFVVAIPLAIWLAFWKPRRFLLVPLIRYLVLRGDPATLFGPHLLTLAEDGLAERGPKSEHRFAWSAVQKVVVSPDHIFVFLSTLQGIIIPRRALPDPQAAESLVALVERWANVKAIRE